MSDKDKIPTVEEIEKWYENEWAKIILECGGLVPSDSHEENEGREYQPLMTEDRGWYFVPHYDDVVVAPVRLGRNFCPPAHFPARPRWAVEVLEHYSNYPHEPDDYDFKEVGKRSDSLHEAIAEARRYSLEMSLQGIGQALYYEKEAKLAPHIESYMKNITKNEN